MARPIYFYAPSFKSYDAGFLKTRPNSFPALSITGSACAYNCKHCGKQVLKGMIDASHKGTIKEYADLVIASGGQGMLVSGGSTLRGSVPFWKVKSELKEISSQVKIFTHTGVVSEDEARIVGESGAKLALLDMVGDVETIRDVLGQPFTPQDYVNSLLALKNAGLKVAPHVIVGLNHGRLKGEFEAISMLKQVAPDAVIVVAFMPLENSEFLNVEPATAEDVKLVLENARKEFPDIPVVLGCARPRDAAHRKIDRMAVEIGVDAIAFPTAEAFSAARSSGRKIFKRYSCCADVVFEIMGNLVRAE